MLRGLRQQDLRFNNKYAIGVVLVPTIVPELNVDNIGKIIDFALDNIAEVRGVHFQPVSYFGRIPNVPKDEDRITLPGIIDCIEEQTKGKEICFTKLVI